MDLSDKEDELSEVACIGNKLEKFDGDIKEMETKLQKQVNSLEHSDPRRSEILGGCLAQN